MELLGTQFTEHLASQMEAYLQPGQNAIPAFLAAVALAVYESRDQ